MTPYYIQNGVRRALAAREAGQLTIRAYINRPGQRPTLRRVSLEQLFLPKRRVEIDARYMRIQPPIREPIEVDPLGQPGQGRAVPLQDVRLV